MVDAGAAILIDDADAAEGFGGHRQDGVRVAGKNT